jgi:hypothetical protein
VNQTPNHQESDEKVMSVVLGYHSEDDSRMGVELFVKVTENSAEIVANQVMEEDGSDRGYAIYRRTVSPEIAAAASENRRLAVLSAYYTHPKNDANPYAIRPKAVAKVYDLVTETVYGNVVKVTLEVTPDRLNIVSGSVSKVSGK